MTKKQITQFQNTVWDFYKKNRRDFPWRNTTDPYHILVSEIMLQQTQTDRVVDKYNAFIKKFPTAQTLARASSKAVLQAWSGLGYNRRAIFLKKAAEVITEEYCGTVPSNAEALRALPGIGAYTAEAIRVFAFNEPAALIETNVRSIFIHHFFQGRKKISDAELMPYITAATDQAHSRDWYSALMDYGVFLKKQIVNPSRKSKQYHTQSRFEGSGRQIRGFIIKKLLEKKWIPALRLYRAGNYQSDRVKQNLEALIKDGLVKKRGTLCAII
ncbi:MAG: A/G-specific adenine glycosylase [bacterium]|nr:A/G-specific adenine glycosylase [bacterium]